MLEIVAAAIPLLPLAAALAIGCGIVTGGIAGERSEKLSATLTLAAATTALLLTTGAAITHGRVAHAELGTWINTGHTRVAFSVTLDALSLAWSALVSLLGILVLRFSRNYMHREEGFHRFFMVLSLFIGSMLLLGLAGNGVLAFAGWELAGICSYLLISYAYDRPHAAAGATYAFVANRVGDAAFVLGLVLTLLWLGTPEWPGLLANAAKLDPLRAIGVGRLFLLAAVTKSAQAPMTPWVTRALEGPTPSSAFFYGGVMIHAGVYLLLRLQGLFESTPILMMLTAVVGGVSACYGFFCGLVQSDVKSALIFSTIGQVGLMFLACGLGWWQIATIHLFAHAIVRLHQFLGAPSLIQQTLGQRMRTPPRWLAQHQGLYVAALQRLWLDPLTDRLVIGPVFRLAADLARFDRTIVETTIGLPAPAGSSLASREQHRLGETGRSEGQRTVGGLPGLLAHKLADGLLWFEHRLVLQGVGSDLWHAGRRLGYRMSAIESLLQCPRYLVLLVVVSVLAIS